METMKFDEASPAGGGASQGEGNNQAAAPKAPRNKKLIWAGIILAALILSVAGWQYWQYTHSVYYQQMKAVKAIEKDLKEQDKWGGKTPEETVRLFTEAVKKGDFELASKYGPSKESLELIEDPIIRNQKSIKITLEKIKTDGKIDQLINWLENGELREYKGYGGNSFSLAVYENNQKVWIMDLNKSEGGTWKIVEF